MRVHTAAGCGGPCDASYGLPPQNWKLLSPPGAHGGFSYADRHGAGGPFRAAVVKPGRMLIVRAMGAGLEHALAANLRPWTSC